MFNCLEGFSSNPDCCKLLILRSGDYFSLNTPIKALLTMLISWNERSVMLLLLLLLTDLMPIKLSPWYRWFLVLTRCAWKGYTFPHLSFSLSFSHPLCHEHQVTCVAEVLNDSSPFISLYLSSCFSLSVCVRVCKHVVRVFMLYVCILKICLACVCLIYVVTKQMMMIMMMMIP